jgi:basic secretory peptidase family protein
MPRPISFVLSKGASARFPVVLGFVLLLTGALPGRSEVKIAVDRNAGEDASSAFHFSHVPPPARNDAATGAKFSLVDGQRDNNGGEVDKLHDGKLPEEADEPGENFFFAAGTDGGRLLLDMGSPVDVRQVNTYSWHPGTRGPQVYTLYASAGTNADFDAQPKKGIDPAQSGWLLIAKVDTRPTQGAPGGQYGVSISESRGVLGNYRYLLFDISPTENSDPFGNTFYSEIDVLDAKTVPDPIVAAEPPFQIASIDGYCEITIDTSRAPELKTWAEQKLGPMLAQWYPRIVTMLPSTGYEAPKHFRVTLRPGRGVAATGGANITANSNWLKPETNPEAIGALIHEEVHVVQNYGGGRRRASGTPGVPAPGWLVEGIPDYIRWFKFEPESHGADLVWMRAQRNLSLRYDAGYRISANFLNYVVETYDHDVIRKLNAACREGNYDEALWRTATGKTLQDLAAEWKKDIEAKLQPAGPESGGK